MPKPLRQRRQLFLRGPRRRFDNVPNDLPDEIPVARLEAPHDERLEERAALHMRPLDQIPPAGARVASSPGRARGATVELFRPALGAGDLLLRGPRAHLIDAPHPGPGGGVGAHAHARGEGLEDGGEADVLGEAEDGQDGDAVVDLVAGDVGAVLGEEGVRDDVLQVDGLARKPLQVGVRPDEGLVRVERPDDEVWGDVRRQGEVEF